MSCSKGRCAKVSIALLVTAIIIIVIILVAKSYSTLEYNQYGFKRHVTQNVVDRSKVFGPGGHYLLGPSYGFLHMPADAQFVTFKNVMVFAKDKLEVSITGQMQYFLRKDQLALMHKKFDVNFKPIIYANALSSLKNKAPSLKTREFLRNRTLVEEELFLAIREHISGPCCENGCQELRACIPGCKPRSTCSENDFGFFVDVRYFQLNALELPADLKSKFLRTQVLYEEASIETFKQEASVVRKETESLIKQLANDANEIRSKAQAEASFLKSEATANATATIESARAEGLQHLYSELNIIAVEEKASFDYLRTLRKQNVKLAVNFQQLIAGKL